jgi:hypothetical protein
LDFQASYAFFSSPRIATFVGPDEAAVKTRAATTAKAKFLIVVIVVAS